MKKLSTLACVISIAAMTSVPSVAVSAETPVRQLVENGLHLNGFRLNGIRLNALTLNAITFNRPLLSESAEATNGSTELADAVARLSEAGLVK